MQRRTTPVNRIVDPTGQPLIVPTTAPIPQPRWDALAEEHYRTIERYVTHRVHTYRGISPEDVTQDIFVTAVRLRERLYAEDGYLRWLYRIASYHVMRTWTEQQDVWRTVSLDQFASDARGNGERAVRDPREFEIELELRQNIGHALSTLSPVLREALADYSVRGLSTNDIAMKWSISICAAEKRITRARNAFRLAYINS